jgi:Flp pilus assembly protein TadG
LAATGRKFLCRTYTAIRSPITSKLRAEHGQAAIEFALVLPLVLFFLFVIVEAGRAMEQKNDLSQMAASGARLAAVGNLPDPSALKGQADTAQLQQNVVVKVTWPKGCTVGNTVRVDTQAQLTFIPLVKIAPTTIRGAAEMRIERAPTTCPNP